MEIKKFNWKKKNEIVEKEDKNNENSIPITQGKLLGLMERFLSEIDIQEVSKRTYFKGLKNFIFWIQEKYTIHNKKEEQTYTISKEIIINYKNSLTKSSLKPHTQSIYLVSLKQFFSWAEANLILPNITRHIKGIRKITRQHHKDPLKKEDIKKILEYQYNKESIIEIRNYLLINMLILTGMRIGETTHILLEDIEEDQENRKIIWIKGKGRTGKDAFVIVLEKTANIINEYLKKREEKGESLSKKSYLFNSHKKKNNEIRKMNTDSISRIVNSELKKFGIKTKRISPHSLRHSYGVYAIEAGVSLYDLQISMRHSTPNTTQVYLGDIEKIKRKEGITEETFLKHITNNNE